MEFLGDYYEVDMPPFHVPSQSVQTLLARAVFQSADLKPQTIASVALASKSIQNSSLGANIASTFVINRTSIPLFVQSGVFSPSSCFSVCLSPEFAFDGPANDYQGRPSSTKVEDDQNLLRLFAALHDDSSYFTKSVQRIAIRYLDEPLALALFFSPHPGDRQEDETHPFSQLRFFSTTSLAVSDALFLRLASTRSE